MMNIADKSAGFQDFSDDFDIYKERRTANLLKSRRPKRNYFLGRILSRKVSENITFEDKNDKQLRQGNSCRF